LSLRTRQRYDGNLDPIRVFGADGSRVNVIVIVVNHGQYTAPLLAANCLFRKDNIPAFYQTSLPSRILTPVQAQVAIHHLQRVAHNIRIVGVHKPRKPEYSVADIWHQLCTILRQDRQPPTRCRSNVHTGRTNIHRVILPRKLRMFVILIHRRHTQNVTVTRRIRFPRIPLVSRRRHDQDAVLFPDGIKDFLARSIRIVPTQTHIDDTRALIGAPFDGGVNGGGRGATGPVAKDACDAQTHALRIVHYADDAQSVFALGKDCALERERNG
jgi:hypothetical protein